MPLLLALGGFGTIVCHERYSVVDLRLRAQWPVWSFFGARCAFLGSFLVCGARFLGSILVHGVWCADFGVDFGARCAFLGSILVRCLLGIDFGAWCADLGSITASGQQDLNQDWRGPGDGGNRARDLSNMGPWSCLIIRLVI